MRSFAGAEGYDDRHDDDSYRRGLDTYTHSYIHSHADANCDAYTHPNTDSYADRYSDQHANHQSHPYCNSGPKPVFRRR